MTHDTSLKRSRLRQAQDCLERALDQLTKDELPDSAVGYIIDQLELAEQRVKEVLAAFKRAVHSVKQPPSDKKT